ncbi:hypothetical protein SAMN05421858_4080 [Haladaptatus litoreus]|uniref:Bacterial Ig-like domain-containing protein n=1 Tax=Haladaptatus litoreus TaxID=553468 RepID=A0A1N7E7C0_9EURY|nr:immunoglobulin-like domain-containing protein [Haladaptatus litoreus]SIR83916.1 hypothetical protein SAMN05421858_4080 [Haladaptatus litoreus]
MKRRTFIASGSVALLGGVAGTTLGFKSQFSKDESQADYQDDDRIVYEHDNMKLRPRQESANLGDTIQFEVTNTSDSKIVLGCNNPWAIQRFSDGKWRHVAWTKDRYYQMCAQEVGSGDLYTQNVTMSKSGLERQSGNVAGKLGPGQYRFVLLGTSPFLATDFTVLDSE